MLINLKGCVLFPGPSRETGLGPGTFPHFQSVYTREIAQAFQIKGVLKKRSTLNPRGALALGHIGHVPDKHRRTYLEVLGDFEFDLSDMGMGILIITFYVEDGILWAREETETETSELTPVRGKEYEFIIKDRDEGLYELKFLKDEFGLYTKCHVKNDSLGINAIGNKLEKRYAYLHQRLLSRQGLIEIRDDLSGIHVALYFGVE